MLATTPLEFKPVLIATMIANGKAQSNKWKVASLYVNAIKCSRGAGDGDGDGTVVRRAKPKWQEFGGKPEETMRGDCSDSTSKTKKKKGKKKSSCKKSRCIVMVGMPTGMCGT